MKALLYALLLTTFVSGAQAQLVADPTGGVLYTQERVVQLPADEHRPYLSIFGNPSDPRYQAVKTWFSQNENLAALKGQTHFVAIDTNSQLYAYRYQATTPLTPCIRLQDHTGQVVFEAAANRIPMSPEALSKALNTKAGCWPWRQPTPAPTPAPMPLDPPPAPLVTPAPFVPVEPEPSPMWPSSIGLIALAVVIGGALGVRRQWKQTHLS